MRRGEAGGRGRAAFALLWLALGVAACDGAEAPGAGDGDRVAAEGRGSPREAVAEPPAPPPDRPVVLVTGSTDGLGRALAIRIAGTGAHVIVHGRDEERGRAVVAEITRDGAGSAHFHPADFAELDQVRALAADVRERYDRIDALVNNAGVGPGPPGHDRVVTPDGNELRFQVNYLAGYLLTHELLPLLRASAPSRVVNVSSRTQRALALDDLAMAQGYNGGEAYGRSKLAQILFTFDLAEALEGTGVSVYAVHPAPAMDTELVRRTGGTPQSSVARGVESVLRAVTAEGLPSGTYFHETEPARAHEQAYDLEARRRLREASEALTRAPASAGSGRP